MTTIERHIVKAFKDRAHEHCALTRGAWINAGYETIRPGDHYDWDGMRRGGRANKPTWLFQYTIKGWGWLERASQRKQVSAGNAFSVKIPSRHRYCADPECVEWTFFWFIVNQPAVVERITRVPQLHNRIISLDGDGAATLLAARELVETITQDQPVDPYRAEVRQLAFAYELERFVFLVNHPMAGRDALLDTVNRHPSQSSSVTDLARDFGMSRTHFSHYFRRVTGESPAAYLKKQRLKQAENLLVSSSLSIKEIAAEAGFTDANHLCKAFRAYFQCSPGDYRRMATSSMTMR